MEHAPIRTISDLVCRAFIAGSLIIPAWSMSVAVKPSIVPPSPVGTAITWSVELAEASPGPVWYRFRIRNPLTSVFRVVRDYGPETSLEWVPNEQEGTYEFEVSARNRETGETAVTWAVYEVTSRLTGSDPVITKTSNSLVFLYSAPPCPVGSQMRVQFTAPDGFRQSTPARNCANGRSMNFYLAGLRQDTEYGVQHVITSRDGDTTGPTVPLKTSTLSISPALTKVKEKPSGTIGQGVLLQSKVFEYNVATDIDGNVIWYCPDDIRYLTRAEPGGFFYALIEDSAGDDSKQLLRVIDLAGNVVRETNAGRINEQLDGMGMRHITSFHHEARGLPGGKTLVLAGTERILRDVQGPGDVDVVGDMILVLNRNLKVEWAWDAFDHLDVTRAAVLGEKCTVGSGGCPVLRLAKVANDWLHGNSLQLTPDGHILYSARHQDWIIKIDYANGRGSGQILWRLGKDGDFQVVSNDPWPWFSHQHDANFESGDNAAGRLLVFDNGNTRHTDRADANSRGQVLQLNETDRTATWILNIDLGSYSRALGSAQKLTNGNYHFGLGWTPDGNSQALEYDGDGRLVLELETKTQQYRSFRMKDLYTP